MRKTIGVIVCVFLLNLHCCSDDNCNCPTSANEFDQLIVTIYLSDLPSELMFNQDHVTENALEYGWSIHIDSDNDMNTGSNGYDVQMSITHFRHPGSIPVQSPILDETQHNTWIHDNGSWHYGHGITASVDTVNNYITLIGDKRWPELIHVDVNDRCFFETVYYSESGQTSDSTESISGKSVIHDAVDDVPYEFVDIVLGTIAIS